MIEMIMGVLNIKNLGRSKYNGMIEIIAKDQDDFNDKLEAEFSKHLASSDVSFTDGKIYVGGVRMVGEFDFIAKTMNELGTKIKPNVIEPQKDNRIDKTASSTWNKPRITIKTMGELIKWVEKAYPNNWRMCLDVCPVAIIKTIDNEEDAKETIKRIKKGFSELK